MEISTASAYANQCKIGKMINDFALSFWLIEPRTPVNEHQPGPIISSITNVHLSPQLAKWLAGALRTAVLDYESQYGQIPYALQREDTGLPEGGLDEEEWESAH